MVTSLLQFYQHLPLDIWKHRHEHTHTYTHTNSHTHKQTHTHRSLYTAIAMVPKRPSLLQSAVSAASSIASATWSFLRPTHAATGVRFYVCV
jgi:hypothetical protein